MNDTKNELTIFWFRRDLRWHDNHALYQALLSSQNVVPIFIFDHYILEKLPKNDARLTFIHQTLTHLINAGQLSNLSMYSGKPLEIFQLLTTQFQIKAVYTNDDYEPYARERDDAIATFLANAGILFKTFKDHVIFEKSEITKADGNPYLVYTPYMKVWKNKIVEDDIQPYNSEDLLHHILPDFDYKFLSLNDLGFEASNQSIMPYDISIPIIKNYEATRNYPSIQGTSKLGPHLRFGTVSIRGIVKQAQLEDNDTFLKELIWREFFMQILWHFPHTVDKAFKLKYERIQWRNNEKEFKAWCEGKTGYPLVDAGMRQLNETGFMHNRVRMLVGSFLCKHLLIDWRWGEAYFAEKLHDYEMASNIGNWQWVASCGVDAAPYFRIFNPTTQIQKFDKDHSYIKKWVPEYQQNNYPHPIVEHHLARERCLETYKAALN